MIFCRNIMINTGGVFIAIGVLYCCQAPGGAAQNSDTYAASGKPGPSDHSPAWKSLAMGPKEEAACRLMDEFVKADRAGQQRLLIPVVESLRGVTTACTAIYLHKTFGRAVHDPTLATVLVGLISKDWKGRDYHACENRGNAHRLLSAMGPAARDAVPGLIALLDEPDSRKSAARTLGAIGPAAEPAADKLLAMLKEHDGEVRCSAAIGLAGIGPKAARFIPQLRESALTYSDAGNPMEITDAIRKLGGTFDYNELKKAQNDMKTNSANQRSEAFELIVRRAMEEMPDWQRVYADTMRTQHINPMEIHAEVHRRKIVKSGGALPESPKPSEQQRQIRTSNEPATGVLPNTVTPIQVRLDTPNGHHHH
jgi:hypothetical protein